MPEVENPLAEQDAAREPGRGLFLASVSIAAALLSLASVAVVAVLSLTTWEPIAWLGPASALGGLTTWAAGVACGGIALGTSESRLAVVGLGLSAFAALTFALMVLTLASA